MVWLHRLEEWLIATLLAVMTCITFMQVVARYVFNYSFVWALELNTFLFAWLIFLGMAYGVRVGAHIGVDALVKSLGPRAAQTCAAIGAAWASSCRRSNCSLLICSSRLRRCCEFGEN